MFLIFFLVASVIFFPEIFLKKIIFHLGGNKYFLHICSERNYEKPCAIRNDHLNDWLFTYLNVKNNDAFGL